MCCNVIIIVKTLNQKKVLQNIKQYLIFKTCQIVELKIITKSHRLIYKTLIYKHRKKYISGYVHT